MKKCAASGAPPYPVGQDGRRRQLNPIGDIARTCGPSIISRERRSEKEARRR